MNKSSSRNSDSSPQTFHSPPSYHPDNSPPYVSPENNFPEPHTHHSRAIVAFNKSIQLSNQRYPWPTPTNHNHINCTLREDPPPPVTQAVGSLSSGRGGQGEDGGGRSRAAGSICRKEEMWKKVALGFRVSEVVLCMISVSVMAADRTKGWSGDSFDRYKEYRYCLSMNGVAFVYSGFQAFNVSYHLTTGKHVISHHLRYQFEFLFDQVLAYLLVSASSSAATRVIDWQSNWGKDEFTEMASASIAMAFLAFVAFAFSSLISGYNLCTRDSG